MLSLYKTIVMNYLLKNGDAHLKNFGVLYDEMMQNISFAPAYDIVNTCVYIHKDKPALTMFGKKLWFGKKELLKFGVQHCFLSKEEAASCYDVCIHALTTSIQELEDYLVLPAHAAFYDIGYKMLDTWRFSLTQQTHKELGDEIIRNWS
jgi:serine/threonine-protein kinase HipA